MSENHVARPVVLLQQHADLLPLLDGAAHAMLLVTPDGAILHANARAEPILDAPTALLTSQNLFDLLPDRVRAILGKRLEACQRGEAPEDLEVVLDRARPGPLVSVSFLPRPPVIALLIRDLARVRAERDLAARVEIQEYTRAGADNRKMIELGKLVAGVTHEMRTPLTYALNHVAMAKRRIGNLAQSEPALAERLQPILDNHENALAGMERVRRLLVELRPLTKNKPHRTALVDLADLVRAAADVFEATRVGTTRVTLDLQSTHPVAVDREDMLNVLANLLNNAAQAMGNEGTITVSTRNGDLPPEIRIRDEGPGIAPEARAHLFEPFLTTKPDGTGLGLFISRRTVEAHGGTLRCEDAGPGATFVIQLPHTA